MHTGLVLVPGDVNVGRLKAVSHSLGEGVPRVSMNRYGEYEVSISSPINKDDIIDILSRELRISVDDIVVSIVYDLRVNPRRKRKRKRRLVMTSVLFPKSRYGRGDVKEFAKKYGHKVRGRVWMPESGKYIHLDTRETMCKPRGTVGYAMGSIGRKSKGLKARYAVTYNPRHTSKRERKMGRKLAYPAAYRKSFLSRKALCKSCRTDFSPQPYAYKGWKVFCPRCAESRGFLDVVKFNPTNRIHTKSFIERVR